MNLANAARYWAQRDPDRVMMVMGDRDVTWGEFGDRTSRLASALVDLGVRPGDRVAVLLENCVEFCEAVVASFKAGAPLVPLNYRLAPVELRDIIVRSGTSVVIGSPELLDPMAAVTRDVESLRHAIVVGDEPRLGPALEEVLAGVMPADPDVDLAADHPALICYTSGTTGVPKGAVLSHRNVLATVSERVLCDSWHRTDIGFIPYAIAFTGGLVSMWLPLYVLGATTVLEPTFEPRRALEVIQDRGVTVFIAVPVVLATMASHPEFANTDFSGMKTLATGGALVTEELIQTYAARGVGLSQQYGLTEGGGLNLLLPGDEALTKIGSTGRSLMHTRIRIVDDAGNDCLPDDIGELIIKGPQVMEGYWEDPDATAEAIVNGWLRTGDLARMDAEGYVRIVDRKKDMLISGGLNIYPAEIERVLDEIGELEESAVIGVPDDTWGEVPAVVAKLRDPCFTSELLLAVCRERLGSYKVPKHVFFRDDPLPRGMSGKVLKRELRKEYGTTELA